MATVRPFDALRPPAALAAEIASVPYDVVDTPEAAALAAGKAWSFLHVIRPEIDLPDGVDLYSDAVYAKAQENLDRWIAEVPYAAGEPVMLVYRLILDGRAQIGVVAGCSVDEYDSGLIAIHERTRKKKEDDRARHVTQMRCQAEPIFLAYRAREELDVMIDGITAGEPDVDFMAPDGIQHTIWTAPDPASLEAAFGDVPMLYVADGHHRSKSASRAREALAAANPDHDGSEAYNRVMAVLFPDSQLSILPYNRVLTDLGGRTPSDVLAEIGALFELEPAEDPAPDRIHCFCVYADGGWHRFRVQPGADAGVIESLDVSLLQDRILEPVFGIEDPRTDPRIDFVGGSRGTAELERRAEKYNGVAFSLFATSLAELFAVADAGEIMPPKSTWFEPKLRSGLFLHRI